MNTRKTIALQKDPSLPSFIHPELEEVMDELNLVHDSWKELKDCKEKYLPREDSEPPRAYKSRVLRTPFDSRFKPAIKAHAGLLSEFSLEDVAPTIEENQDNIDLQGTDLVTFSTTLDEMVLRDGGCGVIVDYPSEPDNITNAAEQFQLGFRPYLVAVNRRNILNWQIEYIAGAPILQRLVIKQSKLLPVGEYGVEEQTVYKVFTPGRYSVFKIEERGGKYQAILLEQNTLGISEIPFRWYSVTDDRPFKGMPPFLNLANLNIEHFQKRSSLNEILHKCNLPIIVRRGVAEPPGRRIADGAPPPPKLVIGANYVVDVPKDGGLEIVEPSGNAISATQEDIRKLEDAMDRVSLAFLTGGEAARTATEVVMDSSQTQCTLKNVARRKESFMQSLFSLWVQYTGEESGGSIKVNESILQIPANAQEVQVILDAMGVKISNELGLKMLQAKKWIPIDINIEDELRLIDNIEAIQAREVLATAQAIGGEVATVNGQTAQSASPA